MLRIVVDSEINSSTEEASYLGRGVFCDVRAELELNRAR